MGDLGPLVLAHRGDHRRWIENTADALLDACRIPGVDGVEFDVRMASDGEPVIIHDEATERTLGVALVVAATPANDLQQVGVPHLADMLALLPPDAFLDIELKVTPSAATFDAIRAARGAGLHRAVVTSFDPSVVAEVRAREPWWSCWLNVVELERHAIAAARACGAQGIAALWPTVTGGTVADARRANLDVAAWTIRRTPTRERVVRLGAVAIVEGAALPGSTVAR
jgi:glycerophosphoryl diester phosphodiesterase